MKHTLALTLAILLLAATGRGQTNETYTISNSCYTAMKTGWYQISGDISWSAESNSIDYSMTDRGIRVLAAEGRICEALGFHCYDDEWLSDNAIIGNAPRRCKICSVVEPNWRNK